MGRCRTSSSSPSIRPAPKPSPGVRRCGARSSVGTTSSRPTRTTPPASPPRVQPSGWHASRAKRAGSIALARSAGSTTAELDVLYVAPDHRRRGVASALLTTLLDHAQRTGVRLIRLRAGSPQPEALAFYRDAGFVPTEPFGRWVEDPTRALLRSSSCRRRAGRDQTRGDPAPGPGWFLAVSSCQPMTSCTAIPRQSGSSASAVASKVSSRSEDVDAVVGEGRVRLARRQCLHRDPVGTPGRGGQPPTSCGKGEDVGGPVSVRQDRQSIGGVSDPAEGDRVIDRHPRRQVDVDWYAIA